MFVELVGCPACGKTHFVKLISNKYTVLDFEYNAKYKTKIAKIFFLLKNFRFCLDSTYWKLRKIINKQAIPNKKFYLRQFRLDYILRKKTMKAKDNCFFSENLINLSSYIFKTKILKKEFDDVNNFFSILNEHHMLSNFIIIYIKTFTADNFEAFVGREKDQINIMHYKTRKLNDKTCMDYVVSKSQLPVYFFNNDYSSYSDELFVKIVERVLNL